MQKAKQTTLQDLLKAFRHPSSALFRAIELKQIYNLCKDIKFQGPSLDLGCGDGKLSSILFDNKFTYGVDNGEAKDYQIAIRKNRYGKVLLENAEKMSLPDKSVNFVFSNSVIEHIPDLNSVFNEVSRILNYDGYFVFTTPSKYFRQYLGLSDLFEKNWLIGINRIYSNFRNKKLNHYHLYDYEYYKKELKKYGIKVINYSYSIDKPTLKLWDLMAIQIKIGALFGKNIECKTKQKYIKNINNKYITQSINKKSGANLLIIAQKSVLSSI